MAGSHWALPFFFRPPQLDSYQLSFAQIVQNICWHLCKALTNKHLQRFELKSTLSRRQFRLRHLNFRISDLFRISIFEFRISGLSELGYSTHKPNICCRQWSKKLWMNYCPIQDK